MLNGTISSFYPVLGLRRSPLAFGFGVHTHRPIDQRLAGEAEIVRLFAQYPIFKVGFRGKIFHTRCDFHYASATLAVAAAVHQFSFQSININAILQGLFP